MQTNNPLFDDLAKLATSAGSTMLEWRKEMEKVFYAQMEKWSAKMDFVTRSEFEAVRDIAQQARLENESLKKRLDALEKKPAAAAKASAAKPAMRSAKPKKTGAKPRKSGTAAK